MLKRKGPMKTLTGKFGSLIRGILGVGVAFGLTALGAGGAVAANFVPSQAKAKMSKDLVDAAENQPAPAMMPATWVPWP